jgi:hypothetical protein
MQSSTPHRTSPMSLTTTAPATIQTTLYDLIAAIDAEVEPGEEELVTAAVIHLLNSGRARFARDRRTITVVRS